MIGVASRTLEELPSWLPIRHGWGISGPAFPTVDVAIVSWNTSAAALGAARSLLGSAGARARVTVIDNRSREVEREVLRRGAGADVRVLLADRNLGYGGGANLALRGGDSEVVCVSNADVMPEPSALARLAEAVLADEEVGMAGPVFAGGTQHYHARLPGPGALLARTFAGSAGRRRLRVPREGETVAVGQVSGAFAVLRRDLWERVGGFDDGYFLWYDDVDLARRLVDVSYRNLVVGSARVTHAGRGSFAQVDSRTAQAIRLASLERYIRVHHPGWAPAARPLLAAARAVRARSARPSGPEALGGGARRQEGHAAVPRQVLEVSGDRVP